MVYSLDLGERVVAAVKTSNSKKATALRYNVSGETVHNWVACTVLAADKAGSKKPWRLDPERLQIDVEKTRTNVQKHLE